MSHGGRDCVYLCEPCARRVFAGGESRWQPAYPLGAMWDSIYDPTDEYAGWVPDGTHCPRCTTAIRGGWRHTISTEGSGR